MGSRFQSFGATREKLVVVTVTFKVYVDLTLLGVFKTKIVSTHFSVATKTKVTCWNVCLLKIVTVADFIVSALMKF